MSPKKSKIVVPPHTDSTASPKQPNLFGPQDEILNALEMEISDAIAEIDRLEGQIEKKKGQIKTLKEGRLDVLKSAREQIKKLRKEKEKEVNEPPL